MKLNSLLVSLLVLSPILYEAQGIRRGKVSLSSAPNHYSQKGTMVIKGSINGGTGKEIICKDDEINCSGLNRKLVTKVTSFTSSTTSKSEMNKDGRNRKQESLSVNSASVAEHHQKASPEQYRDIVYIVEMDYSPARRKPPIHN